MIPSRLLLSLLVLFSPFALSAKKLPSYAKIQEPAINESSGIVRSRQLENVYWTHNDSGDTARIFAIDEQGQAVRPAAQSGERKRYEGIPVQDAASFDWEDIATDDQGNLLIGDFGNNLNMRRDLAIYVVPEPDPRQDATARVSKRIDFHFPEQTAFPDFKAFNFDCESLFYAQGKIYLLTKNRSNSQTQLYRLDSTESGVSNPATLLSSYAVQDKATAADATPDGSKLAVLTYSGCWVFIAPEGSDNYFAGQAHYLAFSAKQCEAIAWIDSETLLITNEQQNLYRLSLADIPPVATP